MTITLYQNSLITLEYAQIYFEERFDSAKWLELDDTEKEKLLITASKKISGFEFVGEKENNSQPLAFPRDFNMPQDIKNAVCEEAYAILEYSQNSHAQNQDANITSISLGAGSVSYGQNPKSEDTKMLHSNIALYLVKKWVKKGFNF
jgi:hypothetical protein